MVFIFCFPATAGISADSASPKEITVVSDDNYPPYIFRDENGRLQGILVDKWQLWEEKTGIRVDLRGMDWDKAQKTMAEGNAQVIDTIFFTEERAKKLAFTAPYASIDVPIFFHNDISGIKDVKSLRGFTIGVKAGDACIDFLKNNGITTLQEFPSYESIIRSAMEQKVKVFCIDAPPALYYLNKMNIAKDFRHTDPLYTGQFHRAVPKERKDLLSIVKSGFAGISQKEHEEIRKRWLGTPIPITHYLVYTFYLMGALVLLGGILLLWNYTLRRKVTQKTAQLSETIDALQKSEEKYRLVVENANEAILIAQDGLLKYVNPMTLKILGYSEDVLTSRPFVDIIHSEDRGRLIEAHSRRMRGEETQPVQQFRVIALDGSFRLADSHAVMISWEGKPATLNYITDITERKRAEEVLRESEANLLEAQRIARLGRWELDLTTHSLQWSDTIFDIFELDPATFGVSYEAFLDTVHPDDREQVNQAYTQSLADRQPYNIEHRLLMKDGRIKWLNEACHTDYDEQGQPVRSVGIVQDITNRKQAGEKRRELEERLHRSEKMESLGILAGGVAHDLNNVLGIVVGYSEMLLMKTDESSPIRPFAIHIMQGGERAAAIVEDLLTLARRGVQTKNVINLNNTIMACQKTPEFEKILSFNPRVRIQTDLETDLLNIMGSPVHLGKTIINLVSNAVEAMPKGGSVKITTTNRYLERSVRGYDNVREGDYVVLSVSDTGEGIAADDLKRIFEPFYTKKVMGRSGTGLGLAVVWGTIKDHNGYIDVQSEEGKGTSFILYFPVTREEISKEQIPASVSDYMGKGESILVVDDVKGQRDLAEEMLKKLNYSVTSVSSGEEAVAYLKEHNVDLMVLDMIMDPGMDGLDTYRGVLEIRPKQKAIIVSGFSESDCVKTARALGAGTYVRKPYVLERLGLAVRKELDRK